MRVTVFETVLVNRIGTYLVGFLVLEMGKDRLGLGFCWIHV
jgi:hypothetical protein